MLELKTVQCGEIGINGEEMIPDSRRYKTHDILGLRRLNDHVQVDGMFHLHLNGMDLLRHGSRIEGYLVRRQLEVIVHGHEMLLLQISRLT